MASTDTPAQIPDKLLNWLYDNGSLTARIQMACAGKTFRVKVLAQHYGKANITESNRLGIKPEDPVLIREVHLICENTAWVYARSIIPITTLQNERSYLANLGEQPLGEALFADPSMHRDAIEIIKIQNPKIDILDGQTLPDNTLWGRQSIFYLANKPLLVNEYFLPAIPEAPATIPRNS